MFTSLSIHNFRCFEALSFDGSLDRVNLIAGTNSVGKTALLEAIYLLIGMGNVALVQKLIAFRGLEGTFGGKPQQISELLWEPLFCNLDSSQTIQIKGKHSNGEHIAKLFVDRSNLARLSLQNGTQKGKDDGLESASLLGDVLKHSHTKPDGSIVETTMKFAIRDEGAGIVIEPPPPAPVFRGSYRATNLTREFEEDAARYTRLES